MDVDPRAEAMWQEYMAGSTFAAIGARYGVSKKTAASRVRSTGRDTTGGGVRARQIARANEMHAVYVAENLSLAEVGERFGGLTRARVAQIFAEADLPRRAPGGCRYGRPPVLGRAS